MKKLLLSMAAAAMTLAASADVTTLVMADYLGSATVEFTNVTIGDYSLSADQGSGTNAPSYNKAGDVRCYYANTLTISCSAGNMTEIVFVLSSQGKNRAGELSASTGTFAEYEAGGETRVWSGDASEVTITVSGEYAVYSNNGSESSKAQLCFTELDITGAGEGGDVVEPETPEVETIDYVLAEEVKEGKCLIVFENDGSYVYATTVGAAVSYTYGYLYGTSCTEAQGTIAATDDAAWEITDEGGYYSIRDTQGRYVYMTAKSDGTYYTSFNVSADLGDDAGYQWTISAADGNTWKIVNGLTDYTVQYAPSYSSAGAYAAITDGYILPKLYYQSSEAGLSTVAVDNMDAPVAYYNLQGQRVMNPERGIFVRVQGTEAVKVVL